MISKDFRRRVRDKFFCGVVAEVSNLILISYIFAYSTIFTIVTFLFQFYYHIDLQQEIRNNIHIFDYYIYDFIYVFE